MSDNKGLYPHDRPYGAGDKLYHNHPKDPRDHPGMQYPYYNIIRVVSGSNITIDDTKGHESVTMQHGVGSMIQFLPNGAVMFRSENDSYEVVFGNKDVVITGSVNVVINGQCDMQVEGDYNLVVHGGMRTTVRGNMETVVMGDETKHVNGSKETTVGGAKTLFVKGPYEMISRDRVFMLAKSHLKLQSFEKSVFFQAKNDIRSYSGKSTVLEAGKDMHQKSAEKFVQESGGAFSTKSGSTLIMSAAEKFTLKSSNYVALDGKKLFLNAEMSDDAGAADESDSANENQEE